MNDDEYLTPPGTAYDIIERPDVSGKAMEVAMMKEHRFAFYYWYKWAHRNRSNLQENAPALVSIDWHQDLAPSCDEEKVELSKLNLNSHYDVALFSWEKLNPLNDGHILAAAHLNLIGNIYVLCKQDDGECNFSIIDGNSSNHDIKCFHTVESLIKQLASTNETEVFFDIDLDYFTESKDPCGGGDDAVVNSSKEIDTLLDPNKDLMRWVFDKMKGMTIATEPEFCGGVKNSNLIFNQVDKTLFGETLFSSQAKWAHK